MSDSSSIVTRDDQILVTGATGFIGTKLVETLLDLGMRNLRCIVRPGSDLLRLEELSARCCDGARVDLVTGNLASREDCAAATTGTRVIFHLATTRDARSFPEAFLNSVVTTRNLLEASVQNNCLKRFVNVSSFTVYSNRGKSQGRLLDESSPVETRPELRADAYSYAKIRQDELVIEYGRKFAIPYVIVRPGYVYGAGHQAITSRVGLDTFGIFLHMGGSNKIPFIYVDNCAEAIALAGLKAGVDGEVFNIVDDDLPSSRKFLRLYKRNVRHFRSVYVPKAVSYAFCYLWERYSAWSEGQLPPAFTRSGWHAYWKKTCYSNDKLKMRLGWSPKVATEEALSRYFAACRVGEQHA
jgi:nucleoside-diphosphate-sugar epimerase